MGSTAAVIPMRVRKSKVETISLTSEQEGMVRSYALKLLKKYVPFKAQGSTSEVACYREVVESTGWRKTDKSGTTCGFLCHWLMWKLGVAEPYVLNWDAEERGARVTFGANISMIYGAKCYQGGPSPFIKTADANILPTKQNPILNRLESLARVGQYGPLPGDIVFIREPGGSQNSEHVFVLYSVNRITYGQETRIEWTTAEAGQENGTDAKFKTRKLLLADDVFGYTRVDGNSPIRTVIGWLDLSRLQYAKDEIEKMEQRSLAMATA